MPDKWRDCYRDNWNKVIVPEAFAHPAKAARGLLKRIFNHAIKEGWIKKGDLVVDPFGGVGTTGIEGASRGIRVVCCELEPKFVELAKQNFALHNEVWKGIGYPLPVIVQGDSRKLAGLLQGAAAVVSSPPFMENNVNIGAVGDTKAMRQQIHNSKSREQSYGATKGQLGNLAAGEVDSVISSPPFTHGFDGREGEPSVHHGGKKKGKGIRPTGIHGDMGSSQGHLGNMKLGEVDAVLSSPPYAETVKGDGTQSETAKQSKAKRRTPGGSLGQSQRTHGYGKSEGNLGNLQPGNVDGIVSSPPYAETGVTEERCFRNAKNPKGKKASGCVPGYGKSEGQLGNETEETFWQAAKEIVQQCHTILRKGGHAIWICKDFVRSKKRVAFSDDWIKLCESCGFKLVCRHHAMLVEEAEDNTFFGKVQVKKERKSFFRRLAEKKGSPKIDWEDVLCFIKRS